MPDTLNGKRILLGVTGGIAAYRSPELVRRLHECGAEVCVVMTHNAKKFISPLTLQAVSGRSVRCEMFDEDAEAGMSHIELARWADLITVAPASANFIARLAHGLADDLLTTLCLASQSYIVVAPAMNQIMWLNEATKKNMELLTSRNVLVFGPGVGDQACGDIGPGRMLEPENIAQSICDLFKSSLLSGLRVMVTAGSTWEAIDPVRGITNQSSGKMGHAIVSAASREGAKVTLISGQTTTSVPTEVESFIRVTSADDMLNAVLSCIAEQDIFISVAAVADYRPIRVAPKKLKKNRNNETLHIELVRNPDILAEVKKRYPGVFTVGFAAETDNHLAQGRKKLLAKGVDMIAVNDVSDEQGAIGSDINKIELIDRSGVMTLGPALKIKVAQDLIKQISDRFHAASSIQNLK